MQQKQTVFQMAVDVLARQAGIRATQTGETFEDALGAVVETEAGRQLARLRDGAHRNESAQQWQESLAQDRSQEHRRSLQRDRSKSRERERSRVQLAAWKSFMQKEVRDLELRKDGQLARLLGDPLPEEPPEALERLASADRRQAEAGLVALMSGGKVFYKHIEELSEADMPARAAASRLRETWLKERREAWAGYGGCDI